MRRFVVMAGPEVGTAEWSNVTHELSGDEHIVHESEQIERVGAVKVN
jgi:hypothetical protein